MSEVTQKQRMQHIQPGGNGDGGSVKCQSAYDAEINAVHNGVSQEHIAAKEELSKKQDTIKGDTDQLQQELNAVKSENQQLKGDKDELEQTSMASSDSVAEISSLKRTKRELESKIEELKDELDEVTIRCESLEQIKSRLELSLQTHRLQHQKEMEARDEEMEQLQSTMNKKMKSLEIQLENALKEKHAAVKANKECRRECVFFSSSFSESSNSPATISDVQAQLEYEQNSKKSSDMMKTLRMQLEDAQMKEEAVHKQHRRLQNDYDELQVQNDELIQKKMELESKVSKLQHEKSKLNEQLEEDQDEMEQIKSEKETKLNQLTALQKELVELKNALQEVQYKKEEAEKKISELTITISNLEHSRARTASFDNSEFKVRELQQTLEFEQTSNRRLEAQVHRLKALMEKMEGEAANSRAESDMVRKLQKQIRELRADITDAERKESDECKKRETAETELEELRAEHVSLQSELKLAQKKLQDLEGEDDDDSVICDNPYSQNGLVSKSKSRSPPKYNNGHSEKPWSFRRSRTSEAQFSSDEDDYLAGRTHRKHNSLGKNLEAPDVDGNDCDDDIVDYNGDSSKNILFEDDPELAKIRAKYIKKKVEDNVD
ncbi:unconventional myosin-XVIIIa-like [Dysidea avara]|uniref:unconventional myosin-XVIIIa-like n=1 Tax=Dysidea avara TaxID=196820 RepID=UPI0033208105